MQLRATAPRSIVLVAAGVAALTTAAPVADARLVTRVAEVGGTPLQFIGAVAADSCGRVHVVDTDRVLRLPSSGPPEVVIGPSGDGMGHALLTPAALAT